jgi:type VI secretion system secreted protein Hcp
MHRKPVSILLTLALMSVIGIAFAVTGAEPREAAAVADAASAAASAATDPEVSIYMTVDGESVGRIEGSLTAAGREGWIEVLGFQHEIVSPRDAASGLPTGKRQHKPIRITKVVDKATPLLMNVLVNNENLPTVELEFVRTSRKGTEEVYFTIELVNASIAGVEMERPEDMTHQPREHISITYQKIIWTWQDGGITAEDDWETPTS